MQLIINRADATVLYKSPIEIDNRGNHACVGDLIIGWFKDDLHDIVSSDEDDITVGDTKIRDGEVIFTTLQRALRYARKLLTREYKSRLGGASFNGIPVDQSSVEIDRARAVISRGALNFVLVTEFGSKVINDTDLSNLDAYWYACSESAKSHWQALGAMDNASDIRDYVLGPMVNDDNWPDAAL